MEKEKLSNVKNSTHTDAVLMLKRKWARDYDCNRSSLLVGFFFKQNVENECKT